MRKWAVIPIGSTAWVAYTATPAEVPELEGCEGFTDLAKCRIYINKAFASDQRRAEEILLHELDHGLITLSGAAHVIFHDSARTEEKFVRMTTPLRHDMLVRAGWLRIPKVPR